VLVDVESSVLSTSPEFVGEVESVMVPTETAMEVVSKEPLVSEIRVPIVLELRVPKVSEEERALVAEPRVVEEPRRTTEQSRRIAEEARAISEMREPVEERRLPVEERRLPVEERRLPVEERRLPVEERRLPVEERRLPVEERRFVKTGKEQKEEKRIPVPSGSIAWRQGAPWGIEQIKYIPPPYNQSKPISLLGVRPEGWKELGRTPQETLQVIGSREGVPKEITIDLGVTDIRISDFARKIEFTGRGLLTDVGERIPGPEKGMSIPAEKLRREERLMITETEQLKVTQKTKPQLADMDAQSALSEIL